MTEASFELVTWTRYVALYGYFIVLKVSLYVNECLRSPKKRALGVVPSSHPYGAQRGLCGCNGGADEVTVELGPRFGRLGWSAAQMESLVSSNHLRIYDLSSDVG